MKMRPLHWFTVLAIALGAMCAFYWSYEVRPWVPPQPILPDAAALTPVAIVPATIDPTSLGPISARPLFIAGRRPILAAPAAEKDVDSARRDAFGDVRLAGILGDGEHGVVILNTAGVNRRVRRGEVFDGWTLAAVAGRSARFSREGETRELTIVHVWQSKAAEAKQADAPSTASNAATAPTAPTPAAGMPSVADRLAERRARREALMRSQAK